VGKKHVGFFDFIRQMKIKPLHWENSRELQRVLHKLPDFIEAVILELKEKALTEAEIIEFLERMSFFGGVRHKHKNADKIKKGIDKVIRMGIFAKKGNKIQLTPAGLELAAYTEKAISLFMRYILSERTSSFITLVLHIVLSVLKFLFGLLSFSAGLIADAVDNTMDTLAALGIWVSIKIKKERAVSLLIIGLMFISLGGALYISVLKILLPSPVENGWNAFTVSAVCGLVMLMLSAYQYMVGKRTANFAILCQAVDSRNHVFTSLLVCSGILITFVAESMHITWLYYADAGASFIIEFLILKSVIGLVKEFLKPEKQALQVSHFMSRGIEQTQRRAILLWLKSRVKDSRCTKEKLLELFKEDFIKNVPRLLKIVNIDFHTITLFDFKKYLQDFIKSGVIQHEGSTYFITKNIKSVKNRRIRRFLKNM
jgi:Co/Zn/Cd efflux system component